MYAISALANESLPYPSVLASANLSNVGSKAHVLEKNSSECDTLNEKKAM
jgi:hypothetical protein